MGLDTSHNCWHGSYSSFRSWREAVARAAEYDELSSYHGYGGKRIWPEGDVLVTLLNHSDCDGIILHRLTGALADRLEILLPKIREQDVPVVPAFLSNVARTEQFVTGLRLASKRGEDVKFH